MRSLSIVRAILTIWSAFECYFAGHVSQLQLGRCGQMNVVQTMGCRDH